MNTAARGPWRLCCAGFSEADHAALRSMLGLLAPHLRASWELVDIPAQADLCLVRLDGEVPPMLTHPRRAGCAQHPRQFAPGTLHRPLRASQLLTLLSETAVQLSEAPVVSRTHQVTNASLRLLAWPLDAEHGPQLHVLAALSAGPATLDGLAARLGMLAHEVAGIIEPLRQTGLLVSERCSDVAVEPAPPAMPGWRGFMAGLGRRFGFVAP